MIASGASVEPALVRTLRRRRAINATAINLDLARCFLAGLRLDTLLRAHRVRLVL